MFYESSEEFCPILTISDLFLRPTLTDGDAVSIREALYLGVPVVASNAVKRPEFVNLFENEDKEAFINSILKALENLQCIRKSLSQVKLLNNADHVMELYEQILTELDSKQF